MQAAWRIGVPFLALGLLGAHFWRATEVVLALACVGLALALPWLRGIGVRLVQVALALGVLEWGWTAIRLVAERQALGRPYLRMALILAGVALFTAAAAWLLQRGAARPRSPFLGSRV